MTNLDFPEICFAVSDTECRLTPPDLEVVRERVHKLPTGYTKTLVRSLQAAFPDKLQSEEDAYMMFDAMKAVIATGLHNGDTVDLEGLGVFRQEKEDGKTKVAFYPYEKLHEIASR